MLVIMHSQEQGILLLRFTICVNVGKLLDFSEP